MQIMLTYAQFSHTESKILIAGVVGVMTSRGLHIYIHEQFTKNGHAL